MNIRIHQGVTKVTLTATEKNSLLKARDVCAALAPYDEQAKDAAVLLADVFRDHCEPEPVHPVTV